MAEGIDFVDGENVSGSGPGNPQPAEAGSVGGPIDFVDGVQAGGPSTTVRGRLPQSGDVLESPNK